MKIKILSQITKAIKDVKGKLEQAHEDYKRRKNRPYMDCSFEEGISQEMLLNYAREAVRAIKGREIEVSVKGPVIIGAVTSLTGLSTWLFKIDFNDYGHITGAYWLNSENDDSRIPNVVADYVQDNIQKQLSLKDKVMKTDEYYCPNCGAVLNGQEGFNTDLNSWVCKKCGKQLVGGKLVSDVFGDVVWYCDNCGAILNNQDGFTEESGAWKCTKCGYQNDLSEDNIDNANDFS